MKECAVAPVSAADLSKAVGPTMQGWHGLQTSAQTAQAAAEHVHTSLMLLNDTASLSC